MTPGKVIDRLVAYAPAVLSAWANPKCVLATATGLYTLRQFGIESAGVAVIAEAANPAYMDWIRRGNPGELFHAMGCWFISNDPNFEGAELPRQVAEPRRATIQHVVLHVPKLGCIIDLNLDQFNRPSKQLVLPVSALKLPWDGVHASRGWDTGAVRYRPWPVHDDSWQAAPDWVNGLQKTEAMVKELTRAIRKGGRTQ